MIEKWKEIDGYEASYSVSNLGRVRRNSGFINMRKHPLMKIKKINSRILKLNKNNGYVSICLSKKGIHKTILVHRLVATAFIPNPLSLPQVNHLDLNRSNNNLSNLEWVTRKQNAEHASKNGVYIRGSKHYLSKLTKDIVIRMRNEYSPRKLSSRFLANKYGIAQSSVMSVLKKKTWTHV